VNGRRRLRYPPASPRGRRYSRDNRELSGNSADNSRSKWIGDSYRSLFWPRIFQVLSAAYAAPGSREKLLELAAKDKAAGLGDAPWPPHSRKMEGAVADLVYVRCHAADSCEGIRDRPTAPWSPSQNGLVERLILRANRYRGPQVFVAPGRLKCVPIRSQLSGRKIVN
jgi:hypothetical protein